LTSLANLYRALEMSDDAFRPFKSILIRGSTANKVAFDRGCLTELACFW